MAEFSDKNRDSIDDNKRRFLTAAISLIGNVSAVCALKPFLSALMPGAQTQIQGHSVTVDLRALKAGEQIKLLWKGKPISILKRSPEMLKELAAKNEKLRDPLSLSDQQPDFAKNSFRSLNPEYLILIDVCTHLGCIPKINNTNLHGSNAERTFICPCHGSIFDLSGRVYKNMPAPLNLKVPPYYFTDPHTVVIGAYA